MTKLHAFLAGCLLAALSAMPASAQQEQFAAVLTGTGEIPANASPGTGSVLITVNLSTLIMDVHASFSGLLGTTTAAHIHCCTSVPGSANVGVATGLFSSFPLGVTSGTYDQSFNMGLATSWNPLFLAAHGVLPSNAFNDLVAGMETGNAYFNVHTLLFPGGEIRGLVHPVPEPVTYALMLAGVGLVAVATKRRRGGVTRR